MTGQTGDKSRTHCRECREGSVMTGQVHLALAGDTFSAPCRRCGRHLHQMSRDDDFTLDPDTATCEVTR